MSTYDDYLRRKQNEFGKQFDSSKLAPQFVHYFNSGERIKVSRQYASGEVYTRTGTIGVTTGWVPAFLLMSRIGSSGSSDVLDEKDQIVAVHRHGHYITV